MSQLLSSFPWHRGFPRRLHLMRLGRWRPAESKNTKNFAAGAVGRFAMLFLVVFAFSLPSFAQTFRGAIHGTVTDTSGAAIPNATIRAVEVATGTTYSTVSSSAGVFQFRDLPVGNYQLTITAKGFTQVALSDVPVSSGTVYSAPIKLAVASQSTTVRVSANALALSTSDTTLSTLVSPQAIQDIPRNGRDYAWNIDSLPGSDMAGGSGITSVNGSRVNSVNWEIEGTDDNDLWWNMPAANESGVSTIAGTLIPMDAIQEFSFTTTTSADVGRNAAGNADVIIKSGTNQLHGSLYYYNRNEALAAGSPFSTSGVKNPLRNYNAGFSVGGPLRHNRLFYFLAYEHQGFFIGNPTSATEPSAAYQAQAEQVLSYYHIPVNPLSTNLLANLWPASALTGPAQLLNYAAGSKETGYSNNGVIKLDANLTDKDHLSAKWFGGQGPQVEPTSSFLAPYFEVSGSWVQNYSIIYSRQFSQNLTNQLAAGVSYIQEAFHDQDNSYNPVSLGLNTGVTDPALSGAPNITIGPLGGGSGAFDPIGLEPLSGRNNTTGELNDVASYAVGAHELRFGGEFRHSIGNEFYHTGMRGTFSFDGSQGPWNFVNSHVMTPCDALATQNLGQAYPGKAAANVYGLADFMAGCVSSSSIVDGNPVRQVFQDGFSLFAQDTWQLMRGLNLNYGLRYEYDGPFKNGNKDLTVFDPKVPGGIAVAGETIPTIYPSYWKGFSPRVGIAYEPKGRSGVVIRGGFGVYRDASWLDPFLNLGTKNGGPHGVQGNPAGNSKSATASVNGYVWQKNQSIFPSLQDALAGKTVVNLFSVSQNFQPSATYEYDLNVQQSLGRLGVVQIGYVGNQGRHLLDVLDINQAALGSAFVPASIGPNCSAKYAAAFPGNEQCSRPYYSQFPNFGVIDQLQSVANSNYNSLQSSWRVQSWHGLSGDLSYTWGHALDDETGLSPYLPQDSTNLAAEYGNSDFDIRNSFTGQLIFALPSPAKDSPWAEQFLLGGWQMSSLLTFHGGEPFTVVASSNTSGNGEFSDRANVIGNPFAGVEHKIVAGKLTWYNPAAFANPPKGTYGTGSRGKFYGPGQNEVDLSVFKNTMLGERYTAQLRFDMFNLFNTVNLGGLGGLSRTASVSGSPIRQTLGTAYGSPGIGPGEPFNVQVALRLMF